MSMASAGRHTRLGGALGAKTRTEPPAAAVARASTLPARGPRQRTKGHQGPLRGAQRGCHGAETHGEDI